MAGAGFDFAAQGRGQRLPTPSSIECVRTLGRAVLVAPAGDAPSVSRCSTLNLSCPFPVFFSSRLSCTASRGWLCWAVVSGIEAVVVVVVVATTPDVCYRSEISCRSCCRPCPCVVPRLTPFFRAVSMSVLSLCRLVPPCLAIFCDFARGEGGGQRAKALSCIP